MITLTLKNIMSFTRTMTLLLSASLTACGGISNNISDPSNLTAESRARNSITELFRAVHFAKKQGPACVRAAQYVDKKHLQVAISESNKADSATTDPTQKDELFSKSEAHALNGLKHINKKRCA